MCIRDSSRAEPMAGGWRLNGSKVWTTNAHRSHYMIALVRTSGTAEDRHQGLSQVIIDLSLPGITIRPIRDLAGDAHFSEVFFDNVELAPDALIGEEGAGWAQVNAELAFERSGPERLYSSIALLQCWLAHCRGEGSTEGPDAALLGSVLSQMAVLRAMSLAVAGKLAAGQSPAIEAALVKDLGTELEQDLSLIHI